MASRYLLMKRGGIEYFNMRVDADVLETFQEMYPAYKCKHGIIKFSLKTKDTKAASELRSKHEAAFNEIFDLIRTLNKVPRSEKQKAIAFLTSAGFFSGTATQFTLETVLQLKGLALDLLDRSVAFSKISTPIVSTKTVNGITRTNKIWWPLQNTKQLEDVHQKLSQYERMFKEPGFEPSKHIDVKPAVTAPKATAPAMDEYPTLSQAFLKWKALPDKARPISSVEEAKDFIDKFIARFDDLPVNKITRSHIRTFRDEWRSIPTNLPNRINRLPYTEVLELNRDGKLSGGIRSNASTNKAVNNISTVLNAVKYDYELFNNPAQRLLLPKPQSDRIRYSKDQLKLLFNSPLYRGYLSHDRRHKAGDVTPARDAYFWIPLMGLFMGCRAEEVCQLYVKDLKQDEGVWYVSVVIDEPDKKLKNKESIKDIPLHPELLKCGILNYVAVIKAAGHKRLFPELTANSKGKYSGLFSKQYGDFTIDIGLRETKDNVLVFHSFRNTFIDILKKAHVNYDVRRELSGHRNKGDDHDKYADAFTVPELNEVFCHVDFGVDLSHLYTESLSSKPLPIKPRPIKKSAKPDAVQATTNKKYKLKVRRPKS